MRTIALTLSATLATCGYLTWYAGLVPPTEFFAPSLAQRLIAVVLGSCLVFPWLVALMVLGGESIMEQPFFHRQRTLRRVYAGLGTVPIVALEAISVGRTEPLDDQVVFRLAVLGLGFFVGGASLYFVDLAYVLKLVKLGVDLADVELIEDAKDMV